LLAGLSAGMAVIGAAEAAGRVALVMVAEDYVKFQKSSIGASRAKLVADALSAKGFDVVLSENPSNSGARASLRDFAAKAAGADVALAVLAGHAIAASGQSFFLPVNADITAPTDLFSRGIAVSSVALMASKAKAGAVLVLMTSPNFATPIEGIDMRPEFASELTPNVVAAFSSSEKVPVSQVEAVSAGATAALAGAIDAPAPTLGDAVTAVVGTGGVAFGTTSQASLTAAVEPAPAPAPAPAPEPTVAAAPPPPPVEDTSAALLSQLDRERQAREEAERQAEDDKARAQTALREAEKAQAELARVQEAARKAQAAADAARAETERAKAEAERAHADAEQAQAAAKAQQDQATADEQRNAAAVRAARAEADAAKAARVQAEAERAKADKLAEERAQAAEAARAQAESVQAEAAARVSRETQRIVAAAPPAEPEPPPAPPPAPVAAPAPAPAPAPEPATVATATPAEPVVTEREAPVDEDADAQRQRQRIQQRLHELGFYQGPLDAIMGPMTRQAIMAYQKHRGEAETGYLTPEQFEALIPPPKG
jgi:hypothetical protein